ncbi:ATP-binding protein [Mesorhizobium escarrei]|uniref:ATP-binding protein n=1 Tax=Mesorhizobium escarrei TaxID=666018 RepID=UPI0020A73D80|nr:ATP-binding protein [Mesorhizobium escarrei]
MFCLQASASKLISPIAFRWLLSTSRLWSCALLNLVLNARDTMPEGGEITIAAAPELPPVSLAGPRKLMIRLSVANRGISPEAPSMVGHPHFSTQTNRTSLVLAIVKQLMESLEGGLTLANTARQGTTVDLWLPAISACSAY